MTDVVERLRDISREMPSPMGLVRLGAEAADEIERLRAEIAAVVHEREDWNGKHQEACIEIERLRAALQHISDLTAFYEPWADIARKALEENQ